MPSPLPAEKYAKLKAAFPELFPYLFKGNELNEFGKVFQELLEKKEVLAGGIFVFDSSAEQMFLAIPVFSASGEAKTGALKILAAEYMEKLAGTKDPQVRMFYPQDFQLIFG